MLEEKPVRKNHLLEGSVTRSIIKISVPIIFANVLLTVYQLIDAFWVGRLGAAAFAAVSLSFPIVFFLNSLAMGFAMAGSILIAQYNGKGDKANTARATGQTSTLVCAVAAGISLVGYFSSRILLSYLTKDPLVIGPATSYLQISFLTTPASFVYVIFQSALRGVGEVKFPLILVSVTVAFNFFLDPLFMYGWKMIPPMGVSGVALATLLTESLAALIAIVALWRGTFGVRVRLRDLWPDRAWIKKIFTLGLPSSLEMSARSFGMFLLTFMVSTFGTIPVAAYGIGVRVLSFVIIPAMGFSIATTALVGNNLGARQHARAEKIVQTAMKIAFSTLMILGIILFIFAKQLSAFLVPGETEVIALAANFLHLIALTFGFIGVQMVVLGAVKAAGQTTTSMLMAMFHSFSLFVLSYLLSTIAELHETGVWIAYPVANVLALILALYIYRRRDWLRKELV